MDDAQKLIHQHLSQMAEANREELAAAADLIAGAVFTGSLLFTGGSGHSLAMVMETFYRAGGLACVYPLYEPSVLPLHGAVSSTRAERVSGVAARIIAQAEPRPGDAAVVFSNSGSNPYPVELADQLADRGIPVVGVTSRPSSQAAPLRAGRRLTDVATVVLDTDVRAGDASYPAEAPVTIPMSTLAGAYLWSLLLAALAGRDETLPVWASSNVPGGDESNTELLARYSPRVPMLA